MNAALRESSEKIINDAAKNFDVARALEQLGAKIKNGKVTYPDDETFQACVNLVNSGIVKSSKRGNTDTATENFVAPEDLNTLQKAYADFAKEMGVPIVFFRGNKNFHDAYANQPQLFQDMLDAVNISDEQIAEKKTVALT